MKQPHLCRPVLVWAIFLALFIGMFLIVHRARAHDHDRPDLNSWFDSLRSGKGPCCSDADGVAVSDPDWQITGNPKAPYRVLIDGQWIDVDDSAVITEPNKVGHAMVWPIKGYLGTSIRCFMAGASG